LIQQNFGETINNHGYIRWDVKTKSGKFVEVPNRYVFKTHLIEDITNYEIPEIKDKKVRLKLFYKHDKKEEIKNYIKKIKEKYEIISYEYYDILEEKQILVKDGKIVNKNIFDIYTDYINMTKLKEDKEVSQFINNYLQKMDETEKVIKNLKLKKLVFSNLFTYGNDNIVNFDTLNGVNIIMGRNGLGKTSLIDIILFTIYNTYSKHDTTCEALNRRHNKGYSILTLEVNNDLYEIKRVLERTIDKNNKEKLSSEVHIKKNNININNINKKTTDKDIETYFGTYDDMITSSIILQFGKNFANIKINEQNNLLISIMGLSVYDNLNKHCETERMGIVSVKIPQLKNKLTNKEYEILIEETLDKNEYYKECLKSTEEERDNIMEEMHMITSNLDKEILKMERIKIESMNIELNDMINKNIENIIRSGFTIDEIKNSNDYKQKLMIENDKYHNEIKTEYEKIKTINKVNDYNIINYERLTIEKEKIKEEIEIFKSKIEEYENMDNKTIEEEITNLENKIIETTNNENSRQTDIKILEKLEEKNDYYLQHRFNKDCKDCNHNKDIHNKIGYVNEIEEIKERIKNYCIDKNSEYKKKLKNLEELMKIKNTIKMLEMSYETIIQKIIIEENKKNTIEENKKIIDDNEKIKLLIGKFDEKLEDNKNIYNKINECIKLNEENEKLKIEIKNNDIIKQKQEEYIDEIQRIEELKKEKNEIEERQIKFNKEFNETQILLYQLKKEKEEQEKIIEEKEQYEKKVSIYEKIINLFLKGFKEYIFNGRMSMLEKRINNVLRKMANYEIVIENINKQYVFKKNIEDKEGKVIQTLKICELCGYERVAFNIAIRLALNSMSVLSKNNFLIIDEGFSMADQDNINNITHLFEIIKKEYDFCFIVSHLNEIKNLNEKKINIEYNEITKDSKICIM
jgi:DNA repair exonuclease SbcCD ATPase subunit